MADTVDDLLNTDDVKDLLDKTITEVEKINTIIICYTRKDGSLHWRSNCRRSEGLGLVEVIKYDLLNVNETYEDEK